jgi:hypothetical protein
MLALVTYPYRDRETLAVHLAGEEVELTDARFAELCAGGYVDVPAEKPAEPAEPAAEQEAAPQPVDPAADMTAAELRAVIESKGGFAPRKATKAELQAMLAAL